MIDLNDFNNSFYNKIVELKSMYLKDCQDKDYSTILITALNSILGHFEIQEFNDYYAKEEVNYFCYEEKIVFLVVINMLRQKIYDYEPIFIWHIVQAFVMAKISTFKYKDYLDIFMNDGIYPILYSFYKNAKHKELYAFLEAFIINTLDSSLKNISYESLINRLSKYTDCFYSPVFGGNYDLNSMFLKLHEIMIMANQNLYLFSQKDFELVGKLPYLTDLTLIERDCFIADVRKIEVGYGTRKKLMVKMLLPIIEEFLELAKREAILSRKYCRLKK